MVAVLDPAVVDLVQRPISGLLMATDLGVGIMTHGETWRGTVERAQGVASGDGHDYVPGSPHLRNATPRRRTDSRIAAAMTQVLQYRSGCQVLEVGADHGLFTDTVIKAVGSRL